MVNALQIVGGVLVAGGAGIFVYLGIEVLKRRRRIKTTTLVKTSVQPTIQPVAVQNVQPLISEQNKEIIKQIDEMILRTVDWWNYFFGGTEVMRYIQKFDLANPSSFRVPTSIPLSDGLKQALMQFQVNQQITGYIEKVRPFIISHLCVLLSVRDSLRRGEQVPVNIIAERNINFGKQIANAQRQLMNYIKQVDFKSLEQQGLWKRLEGVKKYLLDSNVTVDLIMQQASNK